MKKRINPENFEDFTYAKKSHWDLLRDYGEDFFGEQINPEIADLKRYQDLIVYAFIRDNVPDGSRILDVGGGLSRILDCFYNSHECWNIDKFEGIGNGPLEVRGQKYRLVKDYMGNFNTQLPNGYFDLVFSVSALEHVPQDDSTFHENILLDIQRVLKPGGYSLHLFDIVYLAGKVRVINKFIYHVFTRVEGVNKFAHPNQAYSDEMYFLTRKAYEQVWEKITKIPFEVFGEPTSINALWRKPLVNPSEN